MAKDFGAEGLGDKTDPPMLSKRGKKPRYEATYNYPDGSPKGRGEVLRDSMYMGVDFPEEKGGMKAAEDFAAQLNRNEAAAKKALKEGKGYAKGGKVASASKRADGCCVKGKTRGKMV
jgi:hypothetical protein